MDNFELFINQIIKEKGLDTEPAEVVEQIRQDLQNSLEQRVNAMLISSLPEEKLPEFEQLLDADNTETIQAFLAANISDLQEKIAVELLQFKTLYLA